MEQSNENGNKPILEIFINEVEMDENPIQEKSTKISIQQTKGSRMPKNEEKGMKFNLEILHIQRNKWKNSNKNSLFGGSILSMITRKLMVIIPHNETYHLLH
jgi:hypothetical protein